jgi:predicted lipoprotein
MSHHPPAFSHLVDPSDGDDWLKVISNKVDITPCNEREKVLYASRRLEGIVSDWWDAFTVAHIDADAISWQEFQENLCAHQIPSEIMKLLYASRRLEGIVSDWWDAFTAAHTDADAITWQEFQENLCAHQIPSEIMKLKKNEFLSLTHGGMS